MKSKKPTYNTNKRQHKFMISVSERECNFILNYAKLNGISNPDELVSQIFRTALFDIAVTGRSKSTSSNSLI